jgi:type III restriction enzyme
MDVSVIMNNTSRGLELADEGGHFYKVDFQVHTPRDPMWSGGRPNDRDKWAEKFVAAARKKGLHAVAISDHHDFAYFPHIRWAAANETRSDGTSLPDSEKLIMFPALELTLGVPCQCLMVLDADFPDDSLDDVLRALYLEPVDPSYDKLPDVKEVPDSSDINSLQERLDRHPWLKDRYILLPNVTPNGHKTLIREAFQTKYSDMNVVGGYLDTSIESLKSKKKQGKLKILEGEDSHWGSKRLALFQTSDARTANFSDLGKHATWVKWAEPTAEAIRQACLGQDSRISQKTPEIPSVWVSKMIISNSKFMGEVDVNMNPQYTAVIGGRGTGKSTLLDYLRWALCDQPSLGAEDDEIAYPLVRQKKLIQATLHPYDAYVEVHCIINGVIHVVRRNATDGSVRLKVGSGEFEDVSDSAIQDLVPIQAYSQKQLSSVAIRVEELMRFVTAPIQRQLDSLDSSIREITAQLRQSYSTLERHRSLSSDIDKHTLRMQSLTQQAQSLRDGLAGLTDSDREILDNKGGYDEIRSAHHGWNQKLADVEQHLTSVVGTLDSAVAAVKVPSSTPEGLKSTTQEVSDQFLETFRTLRSNIKNEVRKLRSSQEGGGAIATTSGSLTRKIDAFESQYQAVKSRSSEHEAKLADLSKLETEQSELQALIQQKTAERESLNDPETEYLELRRALLEAREERTSALRTECDALLQTSGDKIRASVSNRAGWDEVENKFRALTTGSNLRSSKIENFFINLAEEFNPLETWEEVLAEIAALSTLDPDVDVSDQEFPCLLRLGFTKGDQQRIRSKVTLDAWLDLSLVQPIDVPEFEYQSKPGEYIPFQAASAGQQASALLGTLLAQEGAPLIIDQPEDDLDSETILGIVSKIWNAKSKRQLIFSSHNANLVVNGDADLVLVCAYKHSDDQSAGHLKERGAIDVASVRDEITTVMEGGEKAFRLRKEKYGF